jgi:hypothetical protein
MARIEEETHRKTKNPMSKTLQYTWNDLGDCVAILSAFTETIDQACVLYEGRPCATLFLPHDGMVASVELHLVAGEDPPDAVLIAVGRTLIEHKRSCRRDTQHESGPQQGHGAQGVGT